MAYNGSGTYNLYTPGNPVVTATTISSTWANNTLSDIATGLTTAITKDGQTTTTASIPFAVGIAVTTGITTASTTWALANTTATTINAFGAATAVNMGAGAASTLTASFTTAIALNTAAITSNQTTVALLNATATTVNFAGAATTLNIGAATGTLTVANTTLAAKAGTFSTTLGVTGALTYGGVTLSAAVTGTGNMVLSASPTLTGTLTLAAATASGLITANAGLTVAASQAITGTVANSTISGFLSVAATTGTFTNVGGTVTTATQNSVTTMTGLTTVGALNAGSITSGFGSIDIGADSLTAGAISGTTGTFSGVISGEAAGSAATPSITFAGDTNTGIYRSAADIMNIATGGVLSMSFDASQRVIIGSAAAMASDGAVLHATGAAGSAIAAKFGANDYVVAFYDTGNTLRGSITLSGGTTTVYNTSSDARLKNDLGVATDTTVLRDLVIHNFEWKENSKKDIGVFAQEAYKVFPGAITVGGDDQRTKPWAASYSTFVPHLVVGWQNHESRIKALESKCAP